MNNISRQLRYLLARREACRHHPSGVTNYISARIHRNHGEFKIPAKRLSTLTNFTRTDLEYSFIGVAPFTRLNLSQRRFKKRRAQSSKNEDEDEEEEDDDDELANENPLLVDDILGQANDGSEPLTIDVRSLRLDFVCKTAFGMTRNSVEEALYRGDVRINDALPSKKSIEVMVGDEIDIFKYVDSEDSKLIHIRRAIIETIPDKANEHGRMKIKIKRWQDLKVERPDGTKE